METNPITRPAEYHAAVTNRITRSVPWTEPGLRVTRLRLVSSPGYPLWDVSYCTGELAGEPVDVTLPFSDLFKPSRVRSEGDSLAAQIVEHAKRHGVHAKRLGILGCISTLS